MNDICPWPTKGTKRVSQDPRWKTKVGAKCRRRASDHLCVLVSQTLISCCGKLWPREPSTFATIQNAATTSYPTMLSIMGKVPLPARSFLA